MFGYGVVAARGRRFADTMPRSPVRPLSLFARVANALADARSRRTWMIGVAALVSTSFLSACGESPPAPAPTPVALTPRPAVGATVSGLPTAVVTRDPYALPTATTYGGVRATGTATLTVSPSASPSRTASPTPVETALPVASATTETDATPSPVVTVSPSPSPTPTATPTPATVLPPVSEATPEADGGLALSIVPGRSSAAFRVNEQLVGRDLPGDAVGSTAAVSGVIAIGADGEVDAEQSRVVVDLNGLRSDNGMRDTYVRRTILDVDAFPNAVFVPARAEGLPFPLPERGTVSFRLIGTLTIHGTAREVTWDVVARRTASEVSGTANTTVTFSDFGLEPPSVAAVISVSDEIRLEIALVANVAR
jgi:polyisoprenoid-binding protein YceI